MAAPGLIASQWGLALDARLLAARPGLPLQTLPAGVPQVPLPAQAEVLLARPFPPEDLLRLERGY